MMVSEPRIKTKELVILAFLTAILLVAQIALAAVPNIEIVTLLVIIYTQIFGKKVFFIIYAFAILEGLLYGFGIWWLMYLYVWSLLALLVMQFKKQESVILWTIISAGFGFAFGLLCSLPYFFIGGFHMAAAWWIAGIPYDLLHGIGNIAVTLVLYKPIYFLLKKLAGNEIYLDY